MSKLLAELEAEVKKRTTVVMYEPGAGGDFLVSLLTSSDTMFGNNMNIDHMVNGRIKAEGDIPFQIESVIDDYMFYQKPTFIERLFRVEYFLEDIVKWDVRFISKVHPFIYSFGSEIIKQHLVNEYSESKIICLHRDEEMTKANHHYKNDCYDTDMVKNGVYNDNWYHYYDQIRDDVEMMDVYFDKIIKSPIPIVRQCCEYMNIATPSDETIKNIYNPYMDNQKFLEPIARYWK